MVSVLTHVTKFIIYEAMHIEEVNIYQNKGIFVSSDLMLHNCFPSFQTELIDVEKIRKRNGIILFITRNVTSKNNFTNEIINEQHNETALC